MQPVTQSREVRQNALNILIVAILLGLGINVIASSISAFLKDSPFWLLAIGGALSAIGILLLRITVLKKKRHVLRLRGGIAFSIKDNNLETVPIHGYRFNDSLCSYIKAFINENQAFKKIFIDTQSSGVKSSTHFNPSELNFHTIVNSALEYWVLHELDLHLNSYFVHNETDKSQIVTITRSELDPRILENRVIELFTRDMTEREAFMDHGDPPKKGTVVYSTGKGGAIFQRLDIEVPRDSALKRDQNGFLTITNKLFSLTIEPHFEHFATNIPPVLCPKEFRGGARLISLTLRVAIKNKWFLTDDSIAQYDWLDSFLLRLEHSISISKLKERLDPDLVKLMQS